MKVVFLENEIKSLKTAMPSSSPAIQVPEIQEPAQQTQVLTPLKRISNSNAAAERKAAEGQATANRKLEKEKRVTKIKAAAENKADETNSNSSSKKPRQQTQKKQAIMAKGCAEISRDKVNSGDYAGAIKLYSQAIAINPSDSLCHRWLGDAYYNSGDRKQAIREWKEAARLGDRIIKSYLDHIHIE
jgi:tetratricopeptide (TPR) repeat protein